MKPKNVAGPSAVRADDFAQAKLHAIEILDRVTMIDLLQQYGTQFSAKSRIFLDLGIPPERVAVMAPRVNKDLKRYPGSSRVTSSALLVVLTVGDFIALFCRAAKIPLPAGEPK